MINIVIEKDYYAYITTDSPKLFQLLLISFSRKENKYNNYFRVYEQVEEKHYSLVQNKTCIKVKAGLISFLCKSLKQRNITYNIFDKRERIIFTDKFKFITILNDVVTPRNYQIDALKAAFKNPFSILQLPTGTGKSEISALILKTYLYNYNKEVAIYIVPTITLQNEAKERFEKYDLTVNTKLPVKTGCVNILTYALLNKVSNEKFDYKQRNLVGCLIFDEAQHLKGNKTSKIVHNFKNLRMSLGMSATPSNNSDEHKTYLRELNSQELTIFGSTGYVSYIMKIDESIKNEFVVPIKVHVAKFSHYCPEQNADWFEIKKNYLMSNDRAKFVAKYTEYIFNKANLNTVVLLIPEIEWSKIYMEYIRDLYRNNDTVRIFERHGQNVIYEYKGENKERTLLTAKETEEALEAINNPNVKTIFSATSFFYEGCNNPSIQAVINCYGGRDSKRVKQQAGRAMRLFKGKNVAHIHEIADTSSGILMSQFNKRMNIYYTEYNAEIEYSSFKY